MSTSSLWLVSQKNQMADLYYPSNALFMEKRAREQQKKQK
jgi:hypothetical protein